MHRICVFAGSNQGRRPEYRRQAQELGEELARRGLGLVYGGGSIGLMGVIADAVLANGGEAIGVSPRGLFKREVTHPGLSQLYEVGSMHERKALMADLADGFIALPGGLGTFDELFEMITWSQLGIHSKPIGLLDETGYFTPLLALIRHAGEEGFIMDAQANIVMRESTAAALLDRFAAYTPAFSLNRFVEPPPAR